MTPIVIFCVHLLTLTLTPERYSIFLMADTEKPTPTSLKRRVMNIREQLPGDVRALIRKEFPELDTSKGANLIHNVLMGGSSDERITTFLESLVTPAVGQAA